MAPIRITGVVSCSSEDKVSCAKNLLVADSFKKWSTDKTGLTNASVILQLESEQHITGVDIGNNGSAFVEVLVANSANEGCPGEFENLIITSAFMSPSESRSQTNRVKLRMFGKDDLCKPALEKKWDRVKFVCTQPYNKTVPFGLSVVTIQGPNHAQSKAPLKIIDTETTVDKAEISPKPTNAPQIQSTLKSSVMSNESKAASQLLSKLKKDQSSSSSDALKRLKNSSQKAWSAPSRSVIDISDKDKEKNFSPKISKKPPSPKASSLLGKTSQLKTKKDFASLLDNVVFVLSGFQNPLRSDIREIGLSMGAQYRRDWCSDSTHLICAIPNTPKYNQVKGKGIIVRKEWLFDCKKSKSRMPERKYQFDTKSSKSDDSSCESEVEDVTDENLSNATSKRKLNANISYGEIGSSDEDANSIIPKKRKSQRNNDDDEDFVPSQTISSDEDVESDEEMNVTGDSLGLTEKISRQNESHVSGSNTSLPDISDSESETEVVPVVDAETDDETEKDVIKRLGLPYLPEFFAGHRFFLHSDSFEDGTEMRQLNRWLIAYGGKVFEHMCESVNFVITKADCWMPDFHQALSVNSNIKFLHSSWVDECNNKLCALDKGAYYIENNNSVS